MLLRRFIFVAALSALACAPSVPQDAPPPKVDFAVFDVTSAVPQIPLPNDLALQQSSIDTFPPSAQKDLLSAFKANGGFPNDQEVPITIDFQTQNIDPNTGAITLGAPQIDTATITNSTFTIIKLPSTVVPHGAVSAADYVVAADGSHGTLTIHNVKTASGAGPLPWDAGAHYLAAVRGGPNGVKVQGGGNINPSPVFFLLTRDLNLSLPENQALLPGDRVAQAAAGAKLEQLRKGYIGPFSAVDTVFSHQELAVMTTFQIAPTGAAHIETDPGRGLIPLPSDFLLDATGKHVQALAAFGPLAPGIATLDGFSTTAMILAQVSGNIIASTVNKNTVFLYDMGAAIAGTGLPLRVPDATEAGGGYVSEPATIAGTATGAFCDPVATPTACFSPVIGLQPGVPITPTAVVPPLKENNEYVVIITNGVKDTSQQGLSRSTLAQLLLAPPEHPLFAAGASLVSGVDAATAAGLEHMRSLLHPAIAQLKTDKQIDRAAVSMAYSFRTQGITGRAQLSDPTAASGLLQLAALPYGNAAASVVFTTGAGPIVLTAAQAWAKYGLDTDGGGAGTIVPNDHIAFVVDTSITTAEILSNTTGAFDPTLVGKPASLKSIPATVVVPKTADVPACPAQLGAPAGAHCAGLVIFHHGLGASRAAVLTVANALAAKGLVVAAIDGNKHGDRSWCSADSQCEGGTCVKIVGAATQGDTTPPGVCSTRPLRVPTLCTTPACLATWTGFAAANPNLGKAEGYVLSSANYFVSANFFRTRDTLRQDLIDQSALILALSRPPPPLLPPLPGNGGLSTLQLALGGAGSPVVIVGQETPFGIGGVFWEGQSLGAILGTINLAANSRITRGALNVGGGTLVDILTNAPAFAGQVNGLLGSLNPPIVKGTAAYLQFINVAKWVLDPADPINAAQYITGGTKHPTLPDLLKSTPTAPVSQVAKKVIGQLAKCDGTVPNPFNINLYLDIGLGPQSASASTSTIFTTDLATVATAACPVGAVPHGFITSWGVTFDAAGVPSLDANVESLTAKAQDQAAAFLVDGTTLPPPAVGP